MGLRLHQAGMDTRNPVPVSITSESIAASPLAAPGGSGEFSPEGSGGEARAALQGSQGQGKRYSLEWLNDAPPMAQLLEGRDL